MLLITDLLKEERFGEASTSFYNFSGGVCDQICVQGSGYTTWRPASNLLVRQPLCMRLVTQVCALRYLASSPITAAVCAQPYPYFPDLIRDLCHVLIGLIGDALFID